MTKEDYREKVEEHRQEIDLHNESDTKLSRASRHKKMGKKKQSNPIMKLLVFVLIFIPLSILGYVWLIYDPSASKVEKVDVEEKQDDVVVEIVKQDPDLAKAAADDTKEDNKEKPADKSSEKTTEKVDANAEAVKKAEAEKQRLAAEEAKKAEQKLAQAKEVSEEKKAEEAQKVAAQKAKELEEKKKAEAAASGQQKTHTVTSTDNLYRIAIKYYGDGSPANIAKIKAANNLSSDSISTGQVLVITP